MPDASGYNPAADGLGNSSYKHSDPWTNTMSIEFKLPELGENIENGDIVNIMVSEGDEIAANDGVFELETDKAVVEVPCSHAGKITKIHCSKGDTVAVGQTLLTLEPADGEPTEEEASAETEAEASAPEEGEASVDAEEKPAAKPQAAPPQSAQQPQSPSTAPIPAGPAARRIARELGVDLRTVSGSGKHGRITPEDVEGAASGTVSRQPGVMPEPVVPPGEPGRDNWGEIRREKMPRIRRTIGEQMVRSANTIPHVTNFDDADMTDLERVRKSVPPGYLGENIKLTAMPLVIKAVALALRQHPMLNASIDDERQEIVYKQYVNVGIAVDTPRGLVVPNLRNADRMSIVQVARELGSLAGRAREADFAVEDLRGGTFTISNLGAVGGTYSTPIINHPEVAILLLGRSRWQPAVVDGQMAPRLMMPLSLSYDHRLVDGATAGRFLNDVIDYLQSPGKLLLTA